MYLIIYYPHGFHNKQDSNVIWKRKRHNEKNFENMVKMYSKLRQKKKYKDKLAMIIRSIEAVKPVEFSP